MDFQNLAIFITGMVALLLSLYAPHVRDVNMLKIVAAANVAWGVYMSLFGAWTAVAISAVSAINSLVAAYTGSQSPANLMKIRWTFMASTVLVVIVTWQGWHSLLPFAAVCIGTYSTFWLRHEKLRLGISLCILVWGFNSLYFSAWEGVIASGLQIVSQFMGMRRAKLERLQEVRRAKQVVRRVNTCLINRV